MKETQEVIISVLTDKPQYQRDIVLKLKENGVVISARQLRHEFKEINKAYINGEYESVIVSNKNGTYKSNDPNDIYKFNQSKIKHAKSELWSAYNINKKLSHRNQMTMDDFIKECINA